MPNQDTTNNHPPDGPIEKLQSKGAEGIFHVRKELKTRYKVLYIAMVFFGLSLCWYAVWTGVRTTPILSNPVVALIIGIILLALTGKIKKLG